MTPRALDPDVIRQKLSAIERSLDTLEGMGEVSPSRLRHDEVAAAAVERLLSRVVDLAVEVNSHAASALSGRGPGEYAESFRMASEVGMIDPGLTDELVGSVGMRNVIVHQYVDLDLDVIATAVPKTVDGYRRYVSAVAAFVVGQEHKS